MNRLTGLLVAVVVVLVAAVGYLMGQQSPLSNAAEAGQTAPVEPDSAKVAETAKEDNPAAPRVVKAGTRGADLPACPGLAQVGALEGSGDNFLSVREAPTTRAKEITRLGAGDVVYACERGGNENGWYGIVYSPDRRRPADDKCSVEMPVAKPGAYKGPCVSGWVYGKYLVNRDIIGAPTGQFDAATAAPKQRGTYETVIFLAYDDMPQDNFGGPVMAARARYYDELVDRVERRAKEMGVTILNDGMFAKNGIPKASGCSEVTRDGRFGLECRTTATYER